MRKILLKVFLTLLLFNINPLYSKDINSELLANKNFQIRLSFETLTASSYYNINGDMVSGLYDDLEDADYMKSTFDFEKYTIGLSCEYLFNETAKVYFSMPIGFSSLREEDKAVLSDIEEIVDIRKFSLNQIDYFAFGGKYKFEFGEPFVAGIAEIRLPSGSEKGNIPLDSNDFLSDGAFEFLGGTEFGINAKTFYLGAKVLYNYRAEDLSDQLFIRTEAGISTVENSILMVFSEFTQSLDPFKSDSVFNPRHTVLQENRLDIGFLFSIILNENIYAEFSYKVSVWGKNTWKKGSPFLNFGILL